MASVVSPRLSSLQLSPPLLPSEPCCTAKPCLCICGHHISGVCVRQASTRYCPLRGMVSLACSHASRLVGKISWHCLPKHRDLGMSLILAGSKPLKRPIRDAAKACNRLCLRTRCLGNQGFRQRGTAHADMIYVLRRFGSTRASDDASFL